MMKKEAKISLPVYKLVYAFCFTVVLSLIRGVVFTYEVGIAMEAPMAVLALVFCADTYTQEITSGRSEVLRLCPMRKRLCSVLARMGIQEGVLFLLSAAGYGFFCLFQAPMPFYKAGEGGETEGKLFLTFLGAVAVTLLFWGMLSNLLSCLFRNMWAGIGCGIVLWLVTNSSFGKQVLGSWNLFSYTFRDVTDSGDLTWVQGKILCLAFCIIMAALMPKLIRKRG